MKSTTGNSGNEGAYCPGFRKKRSTQATCYDAFGKRRQPNGQDSASLLGSLTTHHGYTGHEMHDEVGLTNMNGRFYDPSRVDTISLHPAQAV